MQSRIGKRIAKGAAVALVLVTLFGGANLLFTRMLIETSKKEDLTARFRAKLNEVSAALESLKTTEILVAGVDPRNAGGTINDKIAQIKQPLSQMLDLIGVDPRLLFEASIWERLIEERVALSGKIVTEVEKNLAAGVEKTTNAIPTARAIHAMDILTKVTDKGDQLEGDADKVLVRQRNMKRRLAWWCYGTGFLSILGTCLVIGIGARRMSRSITDPINALIEGIETVREHEDLSIRIPVTSSDETGRLTEEFNLLLDRREKQERRQKELHEVIKNTNAELKEFAYVVSHDLKAPLRGIASAGSWLASDYTDKLDDDGKEILSLLSTRVQRMHDLIDGILHYSRVGRQKEQMIDTDLNDLVEDVIQLITPPDTIKVEVENRLPVIFCEPTRIKQLFQNLLSNAVKYMDKPEGQIRIGSTDAGSNWRFYVADNGPGIDPKYHDKIFQIFQTLRSGEDFDSTGIGLSVVKKIVKLYGGRIWVESELGKGATFLFELPKQAFHVMDVI